MTQMFEASCLCRVRRVVGRSGLMADLGAWFGPGGEVMVLRLVLQSGRPLPGILQCLTADRVRHSSNRLATLVGNS